MGGYLVPCMSHYLHILPPNFLNEWICVPIQTSPADNFNSIHFSSSKAFLGTRPEMFFRYIGVGIWQVLQHLVLRSFFHIQIGTLIWFLICVYLQMTPIKVRYYGIMCEDFRDHFLYAPSQWETLNCNDFSLWLAAYTALINKSFYVLFSIFVCDIYNAVDIITSCVSLSCVISAILHTCFSWVQHFLSHLLLRKWNTIKCPAIHLFIWPQYIFVDIIPKKPLHTSTSVHKPTNIKWVFDKGLNLSGSDLFSNCM